MRQWLRLRKWRKKRRTVKNGFTTTLPVRVGVEAMAPSITTHPVGAVVPVMVQLRCITTPLAGAEVLSMALRCIITMAIGEPPTRRKRQKFAPRFGYSIYQRASASCVEKALLPESLLRSFNAVPTRSGPLLATEKDASLWSSFIRHATGLSCLLKSAGPKDL